MESELALAGRPVYVVIPSAIVRLFNSLGRLAVRGINRLTAMLGRSE
jgi:hypothetical protein